MKRTRSAATVATERAYQARNAESRAAAHRAWYLRNRLRILAQQKAYRDANKKRIAAKNRAYWPKYLAKQGRLCRSCGEHLRSKPKDGLCGFCREERSETGRS